MATVCVGVFSVCGCVGGWVGVLEGGWVDWGLFMSLPPFPFFKIRILFHRHLHTPAGEHARFIPLSTISFLLPLPSFLFF